MPGLGRFSLKGAAPDPEERGAAGAHGGIIEFTADPHTKESPELIGFISSQTGKIKPLATSDLESFLALSHQLLNIGKPFYLEGIGTLEKKQGGELVFIAGPAAPESAHDPLVKEKMAGSNSFEEIPDFKSVFYQQKKKKSAWKKPVAIALLMIGVTVAIWGGYTVYKRTTAKNSDKNVAVQEPGLAKKEKQADTPRRQVAATPVVPAEKPPVTPAGMYKFVIETAAKERALSRYARLQSFRLDIKMETTDSVRFKLFFLLPAGVADTTRIVDSLTKNYSPPGYRAYVEN